MARKIKAKLIMELREQGQSRRSIAKTRHMSMESVCEVFDIAAERGIAWADVKDVPEDEVYRLFYPDRHVRESVFDEPDWDYVHKEMAKVGVNLRLLHDEYKSDCARRHMVAMGYTRFCERYGDHVAANNLTKRIEHKAGVSCEVDWSGPTIGKGLVDATTGEVSKIYLFVGVLPFSQKAYFEPTLDMKERTWLRCHVHMFEFWGGVPERTVCDNLKTGVVKHPREGEIVLNDAYEALGEHYMTAIMPAQVRKPKQKASAEGTVKDAATWVIAQLRNRVFADFDEVRAAVRECLEAYNAHPFQKREGSRDLVFFEVEAAQLRPLPPVRYDVAQWVCNRSVNLDFHVVYAKNLYSVPHRYAGRKVDLRVGESTIGIYHAGERIATHRLLPPSGYRRPLGRIGGGPPGGACGRHDGLGRGDALPGHLHPPRRLRVLPAEAAGLLLAEDGEPPVDARPVHLVQRAPLADRHARGQAALYAPGPHVAPCGVSVDRHR